MDPNKMINTIVDLVNEDIDRNTALTLVKKALADSDELNEENKDKIIELVKEYSSQEDLGDFIGKVSLVLSNSQIIQDYADKDR